MAETTQAPATRPDVDIEAEIHRLMQHYGPLINDRHRIQVDVSDGVVTVGGYVKTQTTANYFLNSVQRIDGVKDIVQQGFFVDEHIRRDVGHVIPPGLSVYVEYGAVVLSGRLPDESDVESLVAEVVKVPGVNRVLTQFHGAEDSGE